MSQEATPHNDHGTSSSPSRLRRLHPRKEVKLPPDWHLLTPPERPQQDQKGARGSLRPPGFRRGQPVVLSVLPEQGPGIARKAEESEAVGRERHHSTWVRVGGLPVLKREAKRTAGREQEAKGSHSQHVVGETFREKDKRVSREKKQESELESSRQLNQSNIRRSVDLKRGDSDRLRATSLSGSSAVTAAGWGDASLYASGRSSMFMGDSES